jgi:hypothetical protein
MTTCIGVRQRANAALLAAAAAAIVPWSALGAETGALPSAGSAPVAVARPGAAGTGPATSGSGSGAATPSPPAGSTPRAVDPPPSAPDIGRHTTTTTVDWFVRASALLGELVTLALAVVVRPARVGRLRRAARGARHGASASSLPLRRRLRESRAGRLERCRCVAAAQRGHLRLASRAYASAPPPFAFRRHWGGFGGGSTGWVVSERLVRVIVGLVLAGLAAGLGMQLVPHDASAGKAEATAGAASAARPHD